VWFILQTNDHLLEATSELSKMRDFFFSTFDISWSASQDLEPISKRICGVEKLLYSENQPIEWGEKVT